MADRIELESKLAMLERTVDALSGELHEQQKSIAALQETVRVLAQELKKKAVGEDLEPHDTPPPHYGG